MAVEILDEDGNPLPGFARQESVPVEKADGIRLMPRWKNQKDMSPLKGRIVRLKVYLECAQLFAFQVKAEPTASK